MSIFSYRRKSAAENTGESLSQAVMAALLGCCTAILCLPGATTRHEPRFHGPDDLVRAPVVQVTEDVVTLDGKPIVDTSLINVQGNVQFPLIHPNESFEGRVILHAQGSTPMGTLLPVLRGIHAAGYSRLMLLLRHREDNPVFWPAEHGYSSGEVTLATAPGATRPLSPTAYASFGDLAAAAIGLRKEKVKVTLVLPAEQAATPSTAAAPPPPRPRPVAAQPGTPRDPRPSRAPASATR